jgi:23S rRNA G2069 N7-methylase RlmK/C1962 C5-methylase RlmI
VRRLLDLFCGAGGASVGYFRAGFAVTGVDHKRKRGMQITWMNRNELAQAIPPDFTEWIGGHL